VLLAIVVYFSRQIVYPNVQTHDQVRAYEFENETFNSDYIEKFDSKEINIRSYFGYYLKAKIISQGKQDKFVLMCHGITCNYQSMYKYADIYLKNGYSVFLYDHRNHGESQRNYTSLGYFEKKDAKSCIDYIIKKYNPKIVGVHGESMGAATALQLCTIDDRLDFCVEDCGYSNAYDLIKYRALEDHNRFLAGLTKLTDIYLKLFYKFSLADSSALHNLGKIKCPVFFIHGEEDAYVPYYMVHELYENFQGDKKLYTVKNAKHAKAFITDIAAYNKQVEDFLNQYVK